jgi:hypothetical protein
VRGRARSSTVPLRTFGLGVTLGVHADLAERTRRLIPEQRRQLGREPRCLRPDLCRNGLARLCGRAAHDVGKPVLDGRHRRGHLSRYAGSYCLTFHALVALELLLCGELLFDACGLLLGAQISLEVGPRALAPRLHLEQLGAQLG